MTVKEKEQKVAVVEEQVIATISDLDQMFMENAGDGNQNVTAQDVTTPLIRVLQDTSKVCKRTDPAYIPGMISGTFFNTLTRKSYGETLFFVPAYFVPVMMEWKPNMGGLVGIYDITDDRVRTIKTRVDDKGKRIDYFPDTNNDATYIHQHFVLALMNPKVDAAGALLSYDYLDPAVFPLGSTQLKRSRSLNTVLGNQPLMGPDGKPRLDAAGEQVNLPRYAHVVKAVLVPESNDSGSWFSVNFSLERRVDVTELKAAKRFKTSAATNEVKVNLNEMADVGHTEGGGAGSARATRTEPGASSLDDEIPF